MSNQSDNRLVRFKRVKELSGEIGLDLDMVGVRVRYIVGSDPCDVQISYWIRVKFGFYSIQINNTLDWMDCDEGLAVALGLCERLGIDQLELCDPDSRISEDRISKIYNNNNDINDDEC